MPSAKRAAPAPRVISDLLSSRLHTLAGLSAASTTLQVERKYGLTLLEWRSLAQLGGFAPLSLKDLARRAGLEKSYASRTISSLIERGLVASERNDADARGVMLSLSADGQTLYQRVFQDAVMRNERLLAPLSQEQRVQLLDMLGMLTISARQVLDEERSIAAGELSDAEVASRHKAATDPKRGTAIQDARMAEARYLASRLNDLLSSD